MKAKIILAYPLVLVWPVVFGGEDSEKIVMKRRILKNRMPQKESRLGSYLAEEGQRRAAHRTHWEEALGEGEDQSVEGRNFFLRFFLNRPGCGRE